jgi:uncharacterized membrane protein
MEAVSRRNAFCKTYLHWYCQIQYHNIYNHYASGSFIYYSLFNDVSKFLRILSLVRMTIDGVWIDNWIYWTVPRLVTTFHVQASVFRQVAW